MKTLLLIVLLFAGANALAASPSPFASHDTAQSVLPEASEASTDTDATGAANIDTDTNKQAAQATKKRPRLKFKSKGPACMCADGLSEEDIRQQQLNK